VKKKKKKKKYARCIGTGPKTPLRGVHGKEGTTTTSCSSTHGAVMVALSRMQAF